MNARATFGASCANFRSPFSSLAVLTGSLVAGAALFSFGPTPEKLLFAVAGAAALIVLLLYPELALALYVVVGDVKGDERVASLLPSVSTSPPAPFSLAASHLIFFR